MYAPWPLQPLPKGERYVKGGGVRQVRFHITKKICHTQICIYVRLVFYSGHLIQAGSHSVNTWTPTSVQNPLVHVSVPVSVPPPPGYLREHLRIRGQGLLERKLKHTHVT